MKDFDWEKAKKDIKVRLDKYEINGSNKLVMELMVLMRVSYDKGYDDGANSDFDVYDDYT
ncbi:MAG: hypothetical protein OEY10_00160 [Nitrosopumilus sp.]|nr:hypothetical protein [Nitrosopumilus sp.]